MAKKKTEKKEVQPVKTDFRTNVYYKQKNVDDLELIKEVCNEKTFNKLVWFAVDQAANEIPKLKTQIEKLQTILKTYVEDYDIAIKGIREIKHLEERIAEEKDNLDTYQETMKDTKKEALKLLPEDRYNY